jgi:hypothetical protein
VSKVDKIYQTSNAVEVAKAALREIGLYNLAERVKPNKVLMPSIDGLPTFEDNPTIVKAVVKAFWLGHLSEGHMALVNLDHLEWGITCLTCWPDLHYDWIN